MWQAAISMSSVVMWEVIWRRMLLRMAQKRCMERVWKKGSMSSASLRSGEERTSWTRMGAVVMGVGIGVCLTDLRIDSGKTGSGDDRPSHSSKPRVGLSGRMMGSIISSSQKATFFFLGSGWKVSSREPSDGTGEDILVEAVEPETSEPCAERGLEKVLMRDEGRLIS